MSMEPIEQVEIQFLHTLPFVSLLGVVSLKAGVRQVPVSFLQIYKVG